MLSQLSYSPNTGGYSTKNPLGVKYRRFSRQRPEEGRQLLLFKKEYCVPFDFNRQAERVG